METYARQIETTVELIYGSFFQELFGSVFTIRPQPKNSSSRTIAERVNCTTICPNDIKLPSLEPNPLNLAAMNFQVVDL
jgi:hypothetical protein